MNTLNLSRTSLSSLELDKTPVPFDFAKDPAVEAATALMRLQSDTGDWGEHTNGWAKRDGDGKQSGRSSYGFDAGTTITASFSKRTIAVNPQACQSADECQGTDDEE
jgi:hypothetical protein